MADMVLGEDPKKLISLLYNHLLLPKATAHAYQLKTKWETDLGEIEDEQWGEILEISKKVSPKLSHQLTHLYIFHMSYITPSVYPDTNQTPTQPAPGVVILIAPFTTSYGLAHPSSITGHRSSNFLMTAWAPP